MDANMIRESGRLRGAGSEENGYCGRYRSQRRFKEEKNLTQAKKMRHQKLGEEA
jgi:hypothetical protein